MPEISRFYGIVVFMNYNDHEPPHFHSRYQEQQITVEIETGLVEGRMSQRALKMVFDWSDLHGDELAENWQRARARRPLKPIPPLP